MTTTVTPAAPAARPAAAAPGGRGGADGGAPFASALDGALAAGRPPVDDGAAGAGPGGEGTGGTGTPAGQDEAAGRPGEEGAAGVAGTAAVLWALLTGAPVAAAPGTPGQGPAVIPGTGAAPAPGGHGAALPVAPGVPAGPAPDGVPGLPAGAVVTALTVGAGTTAPGAPGAPPAGAAAGAPGAIADPTGAAGAEGAAAVPAASGDGGPVPDGGDPAPGGVAGGPAPAPATAPAPAGDPADAAAAPQPPVGGQVARQVAVLRGGPDGTSSMTVVLTPETLGTVEVSVTLTQGTVELTLRGAHEHGRMALLDALPDLRRDLEAAGLSCSRLEVDRGSSGADQRAASQQAGSDRSPGGRDQQQGRPEGRPWLRAADTGDGRTAPPTRSTSSGVDVRV